MNHQMSQLPILINGIHPQPDEQDLLNISHIAQSNDSFLDLNANNDNSREIFVYFFQYFKKSFYSIVGL